MPGTYEGNREPRGYEKVTGLSIAKALTVPARAKFATLKTETQPVRYKDDGNAPTGTDGILVDIGDEVWYTGKLSRLQFIETAVSATLHVSYYA